MKILNYYLLILCLGCEIFFSYTPLGPVPPRNYLIVLATGLIVACRLFSGNLSVHRSEPGAFLIFFIFLAIATGVDSWYDPKFAYALTRTLIMSFLIFLAVESSVSSSELSTTFKIFSTIVAVSAIAAIMQSLGFDIFWRIREFLSASLDDQVSLGVALRSRPVGWSYNSIELGYQIVSVFPFCYMMQRGKLPHNYLYKFVVFILCWGAIASETRSTVLALGIQYAYLRYTGGKKGFKKVVSLAMIVVLIGLLITLLAKLEYADRLVTTDLSSRSRLLLMYLGIVYACTHPMGSGILFKGYTQFKSVYLGGLSYLDSDMYYFAEKYTPHNQFVNTAVMYGWVGFCAVIIFYYKLFKRVSVQQASSPDGQDATLGLVFKAVLIGYIVNSMFHNAGPFVGDPLSWYLIGMISVFCKMRKPEVYAV